MNSPVTNSDLLPTLSREGQVYVLDLGDSENRINNDWLTAVESSLDEIDESEGPAALVTAATGKFWSNGLDLEWLGQNGDEVPRFVERVHVLYSRLFASGVPTIAAIQGHAFAAGAMFALAHDQRVMRSDRGYFSVPEVNLGIPFTPGMTALLSARLAPKTLHEAATTGRRYTGEEALAAQIVDQLAGEDEVRTKAVELAASLAATRGQTLATIKQRIYASTLDALRAPAQL